ncbi:hypothetical protein RND71_037222 [Anisodus tanguticus]|uniref:CGL160/ATPI domain-containing protein n=1 Tax=Anisodus tanguticus TaxID=243964 RepID=A0AAE1R2Y2_9SOLA|nr:hypothetical protein RND71_037222 [Anisodus tanguticus]
MEIDLTEKLVASSKPMLDPVVEESQEVLLRETRRSKEDPNFWLLGQRSSILRSRSVDFVQLRCWVTWFFHLDLELINLRESFTCRGAAGQPRLLVPVVLVMIYNQWNGRAPCIEPNNALWLSSS